MNLLPNDSLLYPYRLFSNPKSLSTPKPSSVPRFYVLHCFSIFFCNYSFYIKKKKKKHDSNKVICIKNIVICMLRFPLFVYAWFPVTSPCQHSSLHITTPLKFPFPTTTKTKRISLSLVKTLLCIPTKNKTLTIPSVSFQTQKKTPHYPLPLNLFTSDTFLTPMSLTLTNSTLHYSLLPSALAINFGSNKIALSLCYFLILIVNMNNLIWPFKLKIFSTKSQTSFHKAMESEKVYEGSSSSMTILLQSQKLPCSSELVESLLVHNQSSKPSFQGDSSSL